VFATTGAYVTGVVSASGNITGNYVIGNGSLLTGVVATSAGFPIVAGTSNIAAVTSGNISISSNGVSNVLVVSSQDVTITGNLTVTGNATLSGNILGDRIQNGNTSIDIQTVGGNANISVGGVSNVAVFAPTGAYVTGVVSATGNVTGNYIFGNGALLTGVITSVANINNGTSNVTVVSSGGNITVGVDGTGNVVVFAATGEYITGVVSASGNVTGGNLLTAGLISATGNVTGGNVSTSGLISSTGTVTGSSLLGSVVSATANITGGNILTGGLISATSTITSAANITGGNLLFGSGIVSGTGNIYADKIFANISGNIDAAGANTQVQFADTGDLLGASANFTFDKSINTLTVSNGNIIGGNLLTGGLISATSTITSTANITGGNVLTGGVVSATANVTGGNVLTGGLVSATGTVTGTSFLGAVVSVTANVTGGNVLTGGSISAVGNITGGNVNTNSIVGTALTITSTGALNLAPTGNITANSKNITEVADPVQDQDAATKAYVDSVAQGLDPKASVSLATTTTLPAYTYNNGTAGVGATITASATGLLTIDGTAPAVGDRVLIKNETGGNAPYNGIYTVTTNSAGSAYVLTRAVDMNQSSEVPGAFTFVELGAVNADSGYVCTTNAPVVIGTTAIVWTQFSSAGSYTANTSAGLSLVGSQFNALVDNNTTAFDGLGNIIVKAGANLTTPNIGAATGTSISLTGNVTSGNIVTTGLVSATGNVAGNFFIGNGTQLTGILGNNVNMGSNTAGTLVSNAVTLTTGTTVTNGLALLNQVLGKLVPPAPPNFPNSTSITLTGISTYRMANITQVDNTPGANKAVAAGTSVANVLRVATYATNTIANVGPGDAGTITAVRNGANVGNVTLNAGASPSGNGTYGSNLVISNNFDYNSANSSIAAGFWYVFSSRVSGASAPPGWNEIYIADSSTGNTNTTAWYYDNSSPSTPAFSSTSMTLPGSANLLYSSTIPHYTNNNNFTISFNVANISGNTYPTANTLASGSSGGAFAAPATINYNASNIGSNVLNSFASANANTTASITTGFGGSSTGPSMSVNNSYATGTLTLTAALGNTVLWKSGTATAIDESNVVINTTVGTGSGNAYRIVNPGTGNTPVYTGSEAAFNSQSSTLQTYDATVVGSGSAGVLKHDQTNYSTSYLPAGPNLSSGRTGTQYFTMKFVRTAVSKFDVKYTGNIAGMWVALPGSVIDSSSSANGWINMAVAYGGAGYPGVNSPGNGSDGCATGGVVTLNTSVTNSSKTCTFGTVSSSSTATNEIYVRVALTSGQSVTALTLETASN
jgi:hypothetical protein